MKARAYSPLVGFPRRLAAVLLDALLLLTFLSLLNWLLHLDSPALTEQLLTTTQRLALLFSAPLLIALFWHLYQATPGKLLLGCRIVDARSGGHPQAWQILVRLLGYALSAAPAGLGFFWMIWDRRRQGWHDKLARTLVVVDDESTQSLDQLSAECR